MWGDRIPMKLKSYLVESINFDFEDSQGTIPEEDQRDILRGLASRSGPIIPLINDLNFSDRCILERHLCIDTTAAGGNAALLMKTS